MKSGYKITLAAVLIGGGIIAGSLMNNSVNGASTTGQPGTADDPVVTKSYVDQKIAQALKGGATSSGSNTSSATDKTTTGSTSAGTKTPAASGTPSGAASGTNTAGAQSSAEAVVVVVVDVKPGQKLIAKAGAEFIVRNGYALVYSMDASGAIDITMGTEVIHNQPAEKNHLLSFPREGRGIQVKEGQANGLVVMVRGGYTVQ